MKKSLRENIAPVIFIVIVLVLTAISAYPQRTLNGKVTEIIDGKTIMIEMPNGRLKVVLQYIEVPEAEQPLHQIVKEHLQKLVLNKTVDFLPGGASVGQVFLGGVNISRQMLRDGAAWFNAAESGLQNPAEQQIYLDTQNQARNEKRGVWGIEGLKPAWEFRAEKARAEREKAEARLLEQKQAQLPQKKPALSAEERARQANANVQMWADIPDPKAPVSGEKTAKTESSSDDDEAENEDKEAINAESYESLLKIAEIGSAVADDFASLLNTKTKVYDYSGLEASINAVDDGIDAIRRNFKKPKNLTLLKNIRQITQDARAVLKIMGKKDEAVYGGELIKLATRYAVTPAVGLSREKVIHKQVILGNMFKLMKSDFDRLQMNIITSKKV